jgi:hypothetical protein
MGAMLSCGSDVIIMLAEKSKLTHYVFGKTLQLSIPRLGIHRLLPGEECAVTRGRSRIILGSLRLLPEGAPLKKTVELRYEKERR